MKFMERYIGKKCRFTNIFSEWWFNGVVTGILLEVDLHMNVTWPFKMEGEKWYNYCEPVEIEEWPKEWDEVMVKNNFEAEWQKKTFIKKSTNWKYLCTQETFNYKSGNTFQTGQWGEMRPIKNIKIKTEDWQVITITEEKAKELWFKIK